MFPGCHVVDLLNLLEFIALTQVISHAKYHFVLYFEIFQILFALFLIFLILLDNSGPVYQGP